MCDDDSNDEYGTYFINAFLLMKGTRQEEAGHGVFLLGEEDKILPNAHWAPEKEKEMCYSPMDSKAHLKKEQIYPLDMTELPSEGAPKGFLKVSGPWAELHSFCSLSSHLTLLPSALPLALVFPYNFLLGHIHHQSSAPS